MNFIIEIKKEKMIDKSGLFNHFKDLEDGKYIISVKSINPLKTEKDYRSHYFSLVDECANETGNKRNVIHEQFKIHEGIETTKNFTIEDWIKFVDSFKWFAHNKMNVNF